MSKDPGYASSCGSNCTCSTKKNDKSIHDVHIKVLEVIEQVLRKKDE